MVSPRAGPVPTESNARLLAALLDVAAAVPEERSGAGLSGAARHAAELLGVDAGGVLRYLGEERAVIVGVWREGGTRHMPINAELDFDRRNSALGRARSTGLPARADTYEGLRGELPVVMESIGLRASVAAPVLIGERVWGAVVASTVRDEPLPPDAEERLADLAGLVAQAVAAAESRRALENSRLRLIAGADEARRRLERELHEGPHQVLLALLLQLRHVRAKAGAGSPLGALLDDAVAGASAADAALRDLGRGLYPVVLSERGLAAAVQAIAMRASVPVRLHKLPSRRFAPVLEANAYFAVAEAIERVIDRGDASEAAVIVGDEGHRLVVEIHDDGSGADERAAELGAIAERVAAAGGSLNVELPPGGGAIVHAVLPLDGGAQAVNSPA